MIVIVIVCQIKEYVLYPICWYYIKGSYISNKKKKHLSIGGKIYSEQRNIYNYLECVNHSPQNVERGRSIKLIVREIKFNYRTTLRARLLITIEFIED